MSTLTALQVDGGRDADYWLRFTREATDDRHAGSRHRRDQREDVDARRDDRGDFYASLPPPVVVGIEATGSMGWFLRLMAELGITCQVGDPAKIRSGETRRQKHDRRDARLLVDLLSTDRFPSIWMPPRELWDSRALLSHRDQWVRLRTRVKNALQGIALPLPRYAGQRRSELQALHAHLTTLIDALDHQVSEAAQQRPQARRLMTHPASGRRRLATEVFPGDPTGRQAAVSRSTQSRPEP